MRLPTKENLLNILLNKVENYFLDRSQLYLSKLYTAMFSLAYHGLLGVGELTTGSHPIQMKDVFIANNKSKIQIILRTSKTHSLADNPQIIKINKQNNAEKPKPYCPFKLLNEYVDERNRYLSRRQRLKRPLFVFSGYGPSATIQS